MKFVLETRIWLGQ